jgi:hypothetical protein
VELVRKFPEIVEPLRDGRLCITSIVELARVLSPENRDEVLPRFFHCSKREAAEVVAALRPHEAPPRREMVTIPRSAPGRANLEGSSDALGSAPTTPPAGIAPSGIGATVPLEVAVGVEAGTAPPRPTSSETASQSVQLANHPDANPPCSSPALLSQPQKSPAADGPLTAHVPRSSGETRDIVEPLTADLRRFHVTVSRRFLAKLEAARAALSHARPGAGAEEILEAGLDLVLAQDAQRKGLVAKPREVPPPAKSNRIPAHVRRAVWTRDGGRCQWPLDGGGVCGSTLRVELDHIRPRAHGGPSTVENVRLACAVHNQYAARLAFGDEWMDRFTRKAPERGASSARG